MDLQPQAQLTAVLKSSKELVPWFILKSVAYRWVIYVEDCGRRFHSSITSNLRYQWNFGIMKCTLSLLERHVELGVRMGFFCFVRAIWGADFSAELDILCHTWTLRFPYTEV